MATPYIGEVRLFAGNFAPAGWALCQGQLLPIADNDVLFTLIGTTYGGDGQNTFALPDLRGRVPVHQGTGAGLSTRQMGEMGGSETVTLTLAQLPVHDHAVVGTSDPANAAVGPSGGVMAGTAVNAYGRSSPNVPMAPQALAPAGAGQAHNNMAPFLALSYIISLFGIYPSQA